MEVQHSLGYLMKYIEKSGERLIYGGDLPTYFVSDVMDEDVICPYGIDDRKAVLADDFTCMVDGQFNEPVADSAYRAAQDALNGADPSGGAIYYFNPDTATSAWIWSRPLIKTIGKHRFCA